MCRQSLQTVNLVAISQGRRPHSRSAGSDDRAGKSNSLRETPVDHGVGPTEPTARGII